MEIKLKPITLREIVEKYVDNAEEGVQGYNCKLNIRPAYQREFVYKVEQRNEVIRTVMRGYPNTEFPLNVMYWAKIDDSQFELIDGQQRTISLCQYANNEFSINIDGMPQNFSNLSQEKKDFFLNYKLQIYSCTGTPDEKLEWFTIINHVGEPLSPQELLNANYTGTWLTSAKRYFMKSNSVSYSLGSKFTDIEANQSRGKGLETALNWISNNNIKQYMADHQGKENADELWQHFRSVIEWIQSTFTLYFKEMKGLDWGRLYVLHCDKIFDASKTAKLVQNLYEDIGVMNKKGIFEYVLGDCEDSKLLEIRIFDDSTKKIVYATQTKSAKKKKISNCSLCALGHTSNKNKLWELSEMEADHVTAWSKRGKTSKENCEMLCISHNRAKGNK